MSARAAAAPSGSDVEPLDLDRLFRRVGIVHDARRSRPPLHLRISGQVIVDLQQQRAALRGRDLGGLDLGAKVVRDVKLQVRRPSRCRIGVAEQCRCKRREVGSVGCLCITNAELAAEIGHSRKMRSCAP